jgi:RND family efflux transporter MFP subunit
MNTLRVGVVAAVLAASGALYVYYSGRAGDASALAAAGGAVSATAPTAGASGMAGAPPISVSTVRVVQRDQVVMLDANGTVTPLSSVDIRPQVSNVVSKVHVREGQFVKAGELLFTLDDRADQVNVVKALAQLQKDQAALADAQRQLERSRDLLRQQFVSQSAVDTSQTLVESQQAVMAVDEAAVEAARVALGYQRIVASGAGRVGAINVFAGSYVQPGGAPLVTITQLDPIAVSFNLPQRNLGDALQGLRSGAGQVAAQLPDGGPVRTGRLQFVDSAVDGASGTVRVKAVFDNADQTLWPGAYVNVRMRVGTLKDAIVVPQVAVIQGARGKSVYVVEGGNRAALRPVEVVYVAGDEAVVTGLAPTERVIVDGRQNVRAGSMVVERSATGEPGKAGANPKRAESAGPAPTASASGVP